MLKLGVLNFENFPYPQYSEWALKNYFESLNRNSRKSIDVSNAGIWCVNDIYNFQNNCKFLMVVRNGYKVVTSFFNKFEKLMYPESQIFQSKQFFRERNFEYPLDKTFWRPLPEDDTFFEVYKDNIRFALICWYWSETINQYEKNASLFLDIMRFEDLVSGEKLHLFIEHLDLPFDNEMHEFFLKPTNIENRTNYKMNKTQKMIFDTICGEQMMKYYPDLEYYDVKY